MPAAVSSSADSVVRARIDTATKLRAEVALKAMGLDLSSAIRMLLTRVGNDGALPFEIRTPNATTRRAMTDLRTGRNVTRVRGGGKALLASLNEGD